MEVIYRLEKPFRVISNITGYAYWVREVEVDKKGTIENYIIDSKAWSPSRFRGNKPTQYKVKEVDEPENQNTILGELYDIEKNLEDNLTKIKDCIKRVEEIENEKE